MVVVTKSLGIILLELGNWKYNEKEKKTFYGLLFNEMLWRIVAKQLY